MASGDATRTYRFGGHGLGIVIARQLTEMMGGEMEVTRVVGHSPTFFVHVPANVQAAAK
jgi:signal transduction histidine kinase